MIKVLQSITVKNFAIIDNISIDFNEGFTAITGETGAGKSLLIDAIGLLLGDKASVNMIRTGEQKAIIEGVFCNLGINTQNVLRENDLLEDDLLIIRKEINTSGKSFVKVNGSTVTMTQLEALATTLADIHTQNDTKKLFEPRNYLSFIDDQKTLLILKEYQNLRNEYIEKIKALDDLVSNITTYQKEKDYLEYQYDILTKANLKVGELENLEEEYNIMNNFELIFKNLSNIKNDFKDHNINETLYGINNTFEKLASVDSRYSKMAEVVKNAYYDLVDVEATSTQYLNHLEFDDQHFQELIERINYLKDLKYKYKMSVEELIAYRDDLSQKINCLEDNDYLLMNAKKAVESAYQKTLNKAMELSSARKSNALFLEKNIKVALCDLMLDKVVLKIVFTSNLKKEQTVNSFAKNGIDNVDIMISFNPGEELRELSKVASGGEMSRVMLAIKTHLMTNLELSTMIFDEIDSGISGEVAYEVAKKLREISKYTQVLAITHLPIVASLADSHLYISKQVINDKTSTIIKELNNEERINELAKMISPNDQTGKSKELALNMLNLR